MATNFNITELFGANLAKTLSDKILLVEPQFNSKSFIRSVEHLVPGRTYTERIFIIAEQLNANMPNDYIKALNILLY